MEHPHEVTLPAGAIEVPPSSRWRRLPAIAGAVGVGALALSFALGRSDGPQLYHSYLVAYLFGLSLALGGLFFVLLQYATRAGWSVVVRRLAEHVMATLPLFALLWLPIGLWGFDDVFHHWAHPPPDDPVLAWKEPYLNPGAFYVRAAVYFAVWTLLAVWFWRRSRRQDEEREPAITRRLQSLSAPALILFGLTLTYAAIDWIMSLDPHWFSTIFGVYVFAGSVVAILAFLILVALSLRGSGLLDGVLTWEHFHDLGKLLFAFVVFWAYIAFSQFMLIWYANIPEETEWFIHRWHHGWQYASIFLAAGHFGLPFLFLLPQEVKRSRAGLTFAASWLLFMHYVDLYWLVMPSLHHEHFHVDLLDLTCLIGVVSLVFAVFAYLLVRGKLVPVGDPRLAESMALEVL
ncbi:MAG: hypothetical protein D6696_01835 [Acidobacteria bacterium]|nr:MAG: hypothetical protein D6696_01835 [Acidobacteriota bacterium]